ncbi:MFS transporter [Bacillus luteolus]|uniref:MFS transporter n=1 Tax=Litchfieldia luteola TaxID=682179 RepID=A0ABR9QJ36_9BACI|nr:MDR family MFS transporter [Cytobacillus luteolus]MBE4908516.1 MFS transporter [Cytobacillus luteolus]MBP1941368.1 EmrB/QacA subfamily drug resistance transporter [Cytobacillus luteolus]
MEATQRKILTALLISTFLAAIEVTIISTAMPQIVDSLGGFEMISWVFAIYLLTTAITTPIWGKLADLIGRKKIFLLGVTVFLIGSALCGVSQNMVQLIIFRAIQGIGAGAINPITFTIIADVFNFQQRAKVQGLVSSMWGIAGVFGPLVGGLLTDFLSWRWIFFINIPFGVISVWMITKYLKETLETRERKIDYGGAITFTIGISALLFALLSFNQGESGIELSTLSLYGLFGIAFFFLLAFFGIQTKHSEPMMPLHLFKMPDVSISILGGFLTSIILIGLTAYLPLWTQNVLEMGATSSGFTLIPLSIGWPVGAILCGRVIPQYGIKSIAIFGGSLIFISSLLLTFVTPETSLWILSIIIFVMGMGFGFATTAFTVIIQSSVEMNMRGSAGSLNTLMRTLGQTLGVALLGAAMNYVMNANASSGMASPLVIGEGLHTVFIISAIVALVSLLVTLWIPKRNAEEYAN